LNSFVNSLEKLIFNNLSPLHHLTSIKQHHLASIKQHYVTSIKRASLSFNQTASIGFNQTALEKTTDLPQVTDKLLSHFCCTLRLEQDSNQHQW
jgi:hypothetical protein